MTAKKKALALISVIVLAAIGVVAAGVVGIRHYYDNIKQPEVSPRQVIEQYFAAQRLKDYEKAFALVSRQHFRYSFNQFKDKFDMYSPNMHLEITGETIEKGTAVVDAKASVPMLFGTYTGDVRMKLVRIKREWKIMHP